MDVKIDPRDLTDLSSSVCRLITITPCQPLTFQGFRICLFNRLVDFVFVCELGLGGLVFRLLLLQTLLQRLQLERQVDLLVALLLQASNRTLQLYFDGRVLSYTAQVKTKVKVKKANRTTYLLKVI